MIVRSATLTTPPVRGGQTPAQPEAPADSFTHSACRKVAGSLGAVVMGVVGGVFNTPAAVAGPGAEAIVSRMPAKFSTVNPDDVGPILRLGTYAGLAAGIGVGLACPVLMPLTALAGEIAGAAAAGAGLDGWRGAWDVTKAAVRGGVVESARDGWELAGGNRQEPTLKTWTDLTPEQLGKLNGPQTPLTWSELSPAQLSELNGGPLAVLPQSWLPQGSYTRPYSYKLGLLTVASGEASIERQGARLSLSVPELGGSLTARPDPEHPERLQVDGPKGRESWTAAAQDGQVVLKGPDSQVTIGRKNGYLRVDTQGFGSADKGHLRLHDR